MASHWLQAVVSVIQQQAALWSQQEKEENRKREEELDDWLTFPVRAAVVGLGAEVLKVSDVCDEFDGLPGGCPRSRPMGTGHRAEHQHLVESPAKIKPDLEKKKNLEEVQIKCLLKTRNRSEVTAPPLFITSPLK